MDDYADALPISSTPCTNHFIIVNALDHVLAFSTCEQCGFLLRDG